MAEIQPVEEGFGGVTAAGGIALGFSVLLEGLLHDHGRAAAPAMYIMAAITLGLGGVSYLLAHALRLPMLAYALFTDDDPTMRIAVRLLRVLLQFGLQGCAVVLAYLVCVGVGGRVAQAFVAAALLPLLLAMLMMLGLRILVLAAVNWLLLHPRQEGKPTTRIERFVIRMTHRQDPERRIRELDAGK